MSLEHKILSPQQQPPLRQQTKKKGKRSAEGIQKGSRLQFRYVAVQLIMAGIAAVILAPDFVVLGLDQRPDAVGAG